MLKSRFVLAVLIAGLASCSAASAHPARWGRIGGQLPANHVDWMPGYQDPSTPSQYNRVGVIKVGARAARNVLVLEPGTSAGSTYFVPLARWITSVLPNWQVWSVERRENLLEDQSVIDEAKAGKASSQELFDYYLGYLSNPSITDHFQLIPDSSVEFGKDWGMKVAVGDLHVVIDAAKRRGGTVVLGGHSLGGSVVTAYATWDFGGRPGADDLAGLVYIDGASSGSVSATQATSELQSLDASGATPWLAFGGIAAPFAGIFNATGSLSALIDPNSPSLGQSFTLLPAYLKPPVPVTNLAQYGYALNVGTSPASLAAAQAHLGAGVSAQTINGYHTWDGTGALTPIDRYATMFSGLGVKGADGTEWYFPQRLTDDTGAVNNGIANPAQSVLDLQSTMGTQLPRRLRMYAFGAALGDGAVLSATQALAAQSGIPMSHLTLIDRHTTYAHNDPAGAYPNNDFFNGLIPFLRGIAGPGWSVFEH